jgi:hypothetical protein
MAGCATYAVVLVAIIVACFQLNLISVKKIAIGGLSLYKEYNKQMLAMQGLTLDDAAHQRVAR